MRRGRRVPIIAEDSFTGAAAPSPRTNIFSKFSSFQVEQSALPWPVTRLFTEPLTHRVHCNVFPLLTVVVSGSQEAIKVILLPHWRYDIERLFQSSRTQ